MANLVLAYVMPLLAYLFIFTLVYALLAKTRVLGDNKYVHFTLSIVVAVIFILSPMATKFTALTIPWVAIFIFMVFFILLTITFVRGKIDDIVKSPLIAIIISIIILIIFIISAINVFGPLVSQGYFSTEGQAAFDFFTNPQFYGLVVLLIIAGIVSWTVTKK
ncbi:MAG: hypothetical protein KKE23_00400 [Nanoarchaeota archaeon]|nr:hypothetical protein [Nanoarchaeota archaeon]